MKRIMCFLLLTIIVTSCDSSAVSITDTGGANSGQNGTDDGTSQNAQWSIPVSQVVDGGPGKDGIPALVRPKMVNADSDEISVLRPNDLVLVFKDGDDVRAYPHIILDWHEIINDNVGDVSLAITFCPLTGTGIGWGRIIDGEETTFGVSGLLYNTNLIPYDRLTDSNWSQILNESVNGELIGEKPELYQLLETTWNVARRVYPTIRVVSTDTPFPRTYGTSPYGDYNTNNDRFLFPVSVNRTLPAKERVLALIDRGRAKVYRFESFEEVNLIRDTFRSRDYLIVGNENFMVIYRLTGDLAELEFSYVFDSDNLNSEILLRDDEGNEWNVFGEAVSGPRTGEFLGKTESMMAQWFSIPAFYPTEIYGQ
ncbi:DUF3179 domain-containing protein [Allomuricauda sp. d1]|uniref:DUF3179 domain-containing protein n=1 Tax=Allomuricauda sp. d1 TaxID=3136725 RepID=UPI0031D38510